MGEYLFPAQKDLCALCTVPLGERVWRRLALPWVFCSRECSRTYYEKDGAMPDGSKENG